MKKKTIKVCSILLMAIILIFISLNVFALSPSEITPNVGDQTSITKVGNSVIGILRTVGVVLAVVVLIVLGIKYMMGSAEEKAEYKKTMIPYIIGAALIFAASVFAQVIYEFFNGIKISG